MKKYQGIYLRSGRVVGRIDMFTDDIVSNQSAVERYERLRGEKVGHYNAGFDVTLDRVELVQEGFNAVVIPPANY